jgi:hypothetical protein
LGRWLAAGCAAAPPTAKYDEFMRERERKRLEPAPATDEAARSSSTSSGLEAVH